MAQKIGQFEIEESSSNHLTIKHEKGEIHVINWNRHLEVEIYDAGNETDRPNVTAQGKIFKS